MIKKFYDCLDGIGGNPKEQTNISDNAKKLYSLRNKYGRYVSWYKRDIKKIEDSNAEDWAISKLHSEAKLYAYKEAFRDLCSLMPIEDLSDDEIDELATERRIEIEKEDLVCANEEERNVFEIGFFYGYKAAIKKT